MGKAESGKARYKILIVEDNSAVLKIMRRVLETEGYQVLEAMNGQSAVALMAEKPDLILQDLILPDISGYDLVIKLRAHSKNKSLPILAISGFLERPDEPWDTSAGFNGLLVKPISNWELVQTVENYLDPL